MMQYEVYPFLYDVIFNYYNFLEYLLFNFWSIIEVNFKSIIGSSYEHNRKA